MPLPILGLTLLFTAAPVLSCFLFESPLAALARSGPAYAGALLLAYWLAPLTIAFSLFYKHHWFLPLYIVQCLGLVLHTILAREQLAELQFARIVLIGLMFYVGILIGNRNFIYPLLTKNFRFWRRNVRFRVGRAVTVDHGKAAALPALLFDCSTGGVQLSFHGSDLNGVRPVKGEKLCVHIPAYDGKETNVKLEVAWAREEEGALRTGCRALDRSAMRAFVRKELANQRLAARLPTPKGFLFEQDIQQTALVLWLACIALSFALPVFA